MAETYSNKFGVNRCPKCYNKMETVGVEGPSEIFGCTECSYTNQPNPPSPIP